VKSVFLHVLFAGTCVLPFGGCSREPAAAPPRPNVVLVTIDTLRADRLTPAVMPAADRLAARGARFVNARTTVPLTLPAHTSILTGLVPPAHGVRTNGADRLADRHPTIGVLVKNAGYRTAAFVGAFVLDRRFGLARGFDTYDDQIPRDPAASERLEAERPGSVVVDRALAWLDGYAAHPFLVWIHLYDPHAPYNPPPDFLARAQALISSSHSPATNRARYDAEVMYADAQLARIVEWLTAHGMLERTLIVVGGDHGEGLGDHRERTHGMLLYDSTLRVPLVIAGPGVTAGVHGEAVSLVDLAPTILRAAGVTPPPEMSGRNLLVPKEVRLKPDTESYAETEYPRAAGWSPLQALTDGRWKMVRGTAFTEVYDLERDPAEEHDLAAAQSGVIRGMSARLDAIRAAAEPGAGARPVSAETAERLRALGYVASSGRPESATIAANPSAAIDTWNSFEEALDLLNAGRPEALALLRRLAAAQPDAPVIQSTFARALKDAGQPSAALDVYRRAARKWTTDSTILHDLAVAAREAAGTPGTNRRALMDEAARAERAALTLDPDAPLAHNGLGLLAIDANDPAAATREFERAAALDPNNSTYHVNLGNARRASGDRAGAGRAYQQALTIDPRNVDALNGAGVLLVEANRAAEAAPLFERAVAASPDFAEGQLNLGIALQQSGQTARAADAYRRVLATPGDHPHEKTAAAKLLASLGSAR
jgi:tetratricopeptide (TPR) repeat protein